MNRHNFSHHIFRNSAVLLTLMLAATLRAFGFSADFHAASSRLATGRWVKISVSESGIHRLTSADLRRMGFSDPSAVRIYGYGGEMISSQLSQSLYRDDLPPVQFETTSDGIYFYAQGPYQRELASTGRYRYAENPFSASGYYFLTDAPETRIPEIPVSGQPGATSPATSFNEVVHYEKNLVSPGETGHYFVGEDFRTTTSRIFKFTLPGIVPETNVWSQTAFFAKSKASSRITLSVNGTALPSSASDDIRGVNSEYLHGSEARTVKTFGAPADGVVNFGISFSGTGNISMANLNYITLNYTRSLALDGGSLDFYLQGAGTISGITADTRLWDVTSPLKIYSVSHSGGTWSPSFGGERHYAAWTPGGNYPAPKYVGIVANQDIHAMETPDMVIFCHSDWMSQGDRIAALHSAEPDNMKVLVLEWNQVYNEFSSGVPDASAFRKCLKMFHDRPGERQLKYALMFGRTTYDNRKRLSSTARNAMPSWESNTGLSENDSYTTDDFFTFLEDNSGVNMTSDKMSIAIGRLPARNLSEARQMADKIIEYATNPPAGSWKNNVLLIADDQDNGEHLRQTEYMADNMMASDGKDFIYNKVYMDAYPLVGKEYPAAKTEMFRLIEEGTVWWNFIGHANTTSWTHENLLTYTDMNNFYNRRWPFIYAATCNFMRWDAAAVSAAEILFSNPQGGAIGIISATRPVYISENRYISEAMGRHAFTRDEVGRFIPVAEALRRAKNDYRIGDTPVANGNKLRYVYLGDPALRIATPGNRMVVTHINGQEVPDLDNMNEDEAADAQLPIIQAAQRATVTGYIADAGVKLTDFSGNISATLYDADKTTLSLGNGENGKEELFEEHGSRLYSGGGQVTDGDFTLTIPMPSEIADNYRYATLSLYASTKSGQEAAGVNRSFYVYGFDDTAESDDISPVIEMFVLNHSSFTDGEKVNPSPVAIATVSDNIAINLSTAGIGHQMTLFLDRPEESYADVASYYTPSADGTPSGTIAYPLSGLQEGEHTLTLRVWDTGGNFAEKTIGFTVSEGIAPNIFEIYSDANPATVEANFYLSHNRPDAMVDVTLEVFNIAGQRVWTSVQSGRSDLFTSFPIKWDLCDSAGRRVPRGIYIYRAQMKETDGTVSNSVSRKIAVAAP